MKFATKALWAAMVLVCSVSAQAAVRDLGNILPDSDASFRGASGLSEFQFNWQAVSGGANLQATFVTGLAPIREVLFDGVALTLAPTTRSPQRITLFDGTLTPGIHTFSVRATGSWAGTLSTDAVVATVPEPGSVSLVFAGLLVGGAVLRRRQAR